jgi:hypothetical protein
MPVCNNTNVNSVSDSHGEGGKYFVLQNQIMQH